jgi:hypothetical protein
MKVGDRLISIINFNEHVIVGREFYITRIDKFIVNIRRLDNKGGCLTFIREFVVKYFKYEIIK